MDHQTRKGKRPGNQVATPTGALAGHQQSAPGRGDFARGRGRDDQREPADDTVVRRESIAEVFVLLRARTRSVYG